MILKNITATTWPTLNDPDGGGSDVIAIDVDKLIETRMLIQANSGGGKSRTLRRIFEQTHGKVQQLILDWDGEFHTLREKYDYILAAAHGGEAVASLASSALLARRLLELGTSAIIDISDLGAQRIKFVQLFLGSIMAAPRELWHQVLIGIDEAHRFAPEAPTSKDEIDCAAALVALMSDGRKRGFCGLLATQRISKLDKNAAAECNNLLIGRASLDLDIRRAAGVIGMSVKDAKDALPHLGAGEFFVVGPALTPTVERIRMGHVVTTHPTAGSGGGPPTPPRAKVRAILAKLADLPAEAAEELKTTEQLRAKIRELEGAVRESKGEISRMTMRPADEVIEAERKRLARLDEMTAERNDLKLEVEAQKNWNGVLETLLEDVSKDLDGVLDALAAVKTAQDRAADAALEARNRIPNTLEDAVEKPTRKHAPIWDRLVKEHGNSKPGGDSVYVAPSSTLVITDTKRALVDNDYGNLTKMERAFLTVLAQRGGSLPLPRSKVLLWAGYARSGTTNKAFGAIVANGWAYIADGGSIGITSDGLRALGAFENLPTGRALRERIAAELDKMERAFFEAVCGNYPRSIPRSVVLTQTGYARSGSTNKAFGHLTSREYIHASNGELRAAEELFE